MIDFTNIYSEQAELVNWQAKIEVYKNLTLKCWSVRQQGRVKFHCHRVHLKNCDFVVQPAGHAKVLREGRKNVHAFVRGYLCGEERTEGRSFCWDEINYNPYVDGSFLDPYGHPVNSARYVDMKVGDLSPLLALDPT